MAAHTREEVATNADSRMGRERASRVGGQREREGDGHHGSPKREKEAALERTQRGR